MRISNGYIPKTKASTINQKNSIETKQNTLKFKHAMYLMYRSNSSTGKKPKPGF